MKKTAQFWAVPMTQSCLQIHQSFEAVCIEHDMLFEGAFTECSPSGTKCSDTGPALLLAIYVQTLVQQSKATGVLHSRANKGQGMQVKVPPEGPVSPVMCYCAHLEAKVHSRGVLRSVKVVV